MKFTSWLRNITRLDSLCPNGCPRANSRMDRYSVAPRPFLPSHLFRHTRDILYNPVNLLPLSLVQTNETRSSFFFLFFFFFVDASCPFSKSTTIGERSVRSDSFWEMDLFLLPEFPEFFNLCSDSRIGSLIIDPYHWILFQLARFNNWKFYRDKL